ncbi:hypothetical protein [Celeribacter indicus]|uniref:Uncharacterized protein n=1 Tax=Celeribacter indicus TaxID=1208324 RepID=A0A0B5DWD3_9RHOB|nr:hypothetical protein [Celeribacter indicus]AJE47678.1 hypothetical protein P73_2963 [Celeribacter indicus]SDW14029.1 hypothetical protein SAMN05443573_101524 [Celeribacter indicus]
MEEYAPGDIIEIQTEKGLAYVQLTHLHPSYPPVVKFLKGRYKDRPDNVLSLSGKGEETVAMVPLSGVLRKLNLPHAKVGEAEIPHGERKFPTFRTPIRDKQGQIIYWWFWDGRGLTYSSELDEVQESLPLREVMSSERFLERLLEDAV